VGGQMDFADDTGTVCDKNRVINLGCEFADLVDSHDSFQSKEGGFG
jgi:hypothetical protein